MQSDGNVSLRGVNSIDRVDNVVRSIKKISDNGESVVDLSELGCRIGETQNVLRGYSSTTYNQTGSMSQVVET